VNPSLLGVRNLRKVFEPNVVALNGLSFDVQAGEFLVVIGLSGSGKSTLLRCLNRLLEPTAGEIYFRGQRIDNVRGQDVLRVRKDIAMIFQHFNLILRHTVLSNVLMGRLASVPTWKSIVGLFSKDDMEMAMEALRLVGIAEFAKFRADRLSGGQQQRVAIARALCQKPQVLLADEPVASLDPATCHTVMDYLRRVNRELGITVICNLHFLSLVRQYATRVIALRAGEIVYQGPPSDVGPAWFKTIYGVEAREFAMD
jgi:phosphonate transport system ATP-binding protein